MLNINIKSIPHKKQRYPTCGDYFENKKTNFRISELADWRWEFLIALHEIVEWAIVKHLEIPLKVINDFDKKYEEERSLGFHSSRDEPGFDKRSPYRTAHKVATWVERFVAFFLGVKWKQYENVINAL